MTGNTVFILGAGASADAGAPLMKDFLSVAQNKASGSQRELSIIRKGIKILSREHAELAISANNLESVFTAFEKAEALGRCPGLEPDEIKQLVPAMRQVILETLDNTVVYPLDDRDRPKAPGLYGDFVQLVSGLRKTRMPEHTVAVITFNYDMAIDHAFCIKSMDTNYFLKGGGRGVPLLKLHGSLNWARRKGSNKIEYLSVGRYLTDYINNHNYDFSTSDHILIPVTKYIQQHRDFREGYADAPVIVPPTWDKFSHYGKIASVWGAASEYLADAENIFIIGYSVPETDSFFRDLVAEGVDNNMLLKRFWVFNPDAEIKGKIESLGFDTGEKFKFFPQYFSEAINELRDKFSLE